MKTLSTLWSAMRRMPGNLRFLTIGALVLGSMAPIQAFIPTSVTYWKKGVEIPLSLQAYWRMGFGPGFIGLGVLCFCFAYGSLRARSWVRHLVAAVVWTVAIFPAVSGRIDVKLAVDTVFGVGFASFVSWYFYCHREMRAFFHRGDQHQRLSPN